MPTSNARPAGFRTIVTSAPQSSPISHRISWRGWTTGQTLRTGLRVLPLLPFMLQAATEVTLDSSVLGLNGEVRNSQVLRSAINAPVGTACSTNAVANRAWGWTDGGGTAFGRAQVGWLQCSTVGNATAQMTAASTVVAAQGRALAHASWTDTFTVSAGTQPLGQLGEFTVDLKLSGYLLLGSDPPQSSVYIRLFVRVADSYGADTRFAGGTLIKRANSGSLQTLPMDGALIGPGTYPVKFRFHVGRPATLTAWLESEADARAATVSVAEGVRFGQATSDFAHTFSWAGVTEVRVVDGAVLTDAAIASDSGFDYQLGAIPEAPVITRVQAVTEGMRLEWTDLGPRPYTVESLESPSSGNWTPVPRIAWPIRTNSILVPLPNGPSVWYRLRVD